MLDSIENSLPTLPRRFLQLNRAIASLGCSLLRRGTAAVGESGEAVSDAALTGARTVSGQAMSVVDRTTKAAADGSREVTGQARAQSKRLVETIENEAASLADQAETITEDLTEASYASWTRADLYERAQRLDIEGRSSMNKAELVEALTNAAASNVSADV